MLPHPQWMQHCGNMQHCRTGRDIKGCRQPKDKQLQVGSAPFTAGQMTRATRRRSTQLMINISQLGTQLNRAQLDQERRSAQAGRAFRMHLGDPRLTVQHGISMDGLSVNMLSMRRTSVKILIGDAPLDAPIGAPFSLLLAQPGSLSGPVRIAIAILALGSTKQHTLLHE